MSNEQTTNTKKGELEEFKSNAMVAKSPSFFDLGKARQTIYSILMGFVLKYFIEHTYEIRDIIFSLDTVHLIVYLSILAYFFLNCFRFLFGLVDYSNMTDDKFAPQEDDWKRVNFLKNTFKAFVINTGVFQLIIFSFSVFLLFPHFDAGAETSTEIKVSELIVSMPQIIMSFCISSLLLLVIDIASLSLFIKYVENKDFDEHEQVRFIIWYFSDLIESIIAIWLLISIRLSIPICATRCQVILFVLMALLALAETISIYKYFESPLRSLRDLIRRLKETVKNWKKEK